MLEKLAMTEFVEKVPNNASLRGLGRFLKSKKEFKFSAFSSSKTGFTLAEVLITLGIIGIVAAMTLPTVMNNARNKQLEAGLKRSYSLIAQALDRYQAETGERIASGNVASLKLKPMFIKYFEVAQDCGWGLVTEYTNTKGCVNNYSGVDAQNSKKYRTYSGQADINLGYFDDGQFVLKDGSLIMLENPKAPDNSIIYAPLYISVDVNGFNKNPNRLGQDLFMFEIDDKGKLLPMGVRGTKYYSAGDEYCSNNSSNNMNGAGCTYKALNEKDFFKNLPK